MRITSVSSFSEETETEAEADARISTYRLRILGLRSVRVSDVRDGRTFD
jgi:hypothetical protein